MTARWTCTWLCLAWVLCASSALAQSHCEAPATTPTDLQQDDYGIELFNGVVLGGGRPVGMAGAYSAVADGIAGAPFNPAAYAERSEHELDWWEIDLSADIYLGGFFADNDVGNDGCLNSESTDAVQLFFGGRMLFSRVGIGGSLQLESFTLRSGAAGLEATEGTLATWRVGTGYGFMDGELVGGLGVRGVAFELNAQGTEDQPTETLARLTGIGFELGALYRPENKRYRLGAAVRSAVLGFDDLLTPEERAQVQQRRGIWVPASVEMPLEVQFGLAYQFGERRSNPHWPGDNRRLRHVRKQVRAGTYEPPPTHGGEPYGELPERERAAVKRAFEIEVEAERRYIETQPRRYTLLTADLIVYGAASDNIHGIDAFITQRAQRAGETVDVGLRVGAESELVPMRLQVRGGFYVEPSRFEESRYRPHITAGMDVRLFKLWLWDIRARGTLDLALRFNEGRYIDWGLSLGFWH